MAKMGKWEMFFPVFCACSRLCLTPTNPFFVRKNLSPLTRNKNVAVSAVFSCLIERIGGISNIGSGFRLPNCLSPSNVVVRFFFFLGSDVRFKRKMRAVSLAPESDGRSENFASY